MTAPLHFDAIGSTNQWLLAHATALPDGQWVHATRQTAGYGRRGRPWSDGAGNLMASVLVRETGAIQQLSFVAALALAEALDRHAPGRLGLKWPNDLLLDGVKCAGILLERQADDLVIGFGVNLASHPAGTERPATSLAASGLDVPAPAALLALLMPALAAWRDRWRSQGFSPIRAAWLARASGVGAPMVARLPGSELHGRFEGLADDGALLLRGADGGLHHVHSGEVFAL